MVPSTLIRMASARTVWKPFECAASRASHGRPPAALGGLVPLAPRIGPRDRQLEGLVQRGLAHLARQLADALGRDAGDVLGPFGRGVGNAVAQQLERGATRVPSASV
jgi:hypothetical protein